MMKRAFRDAWSAALRSGEYAQGREALNREGNFCCLGVRCELDVTEGTMSKVDGESFTWYDGMDNMPSDATLIRWGLSEAQANHLARMNDTEHLTFDEIADYLDSLEVED